MTTHEYAFDAKLAAVLRVVAPSEQIARQTIERILDAVNLNTTSEDSLGRVKITEASAYLDDCAGPYLFEIDGKSVEGFDD
jgi:hypothetical protein